MIFSASSQETILTDWNLFITDGRDSYDYVGTNYTESCSNSRVVPKNNLKRKSREAKTLVPVA